MSKRNDLTGQTFNSWQVLRYVKTENKIPFYECKCLICNTDYIIDGRNLPRGRSKRCRKCADKINKTGKRNYGIPAREYAISRLLKGYKDGATKRNLSCSLTTETFGEFIFKNCHYCGRPPNTYVNPLKGSSLSKEKEEEGWLYYNGIDRLNSDLGYEPGNMVTCCVQCNRAKGSSNYQEFLKYLMDLVNFRKNL